MLGAVLCWAMYAVLSRTLLHRHSPLFVTGWTMIAGTAAFAATVWRDVARVRVGRPSGLGVARHDPVGVDRPHACVPDLLRVGDAHRRRADDGVDQHGAARRDGDRLGGPRRVGRRVEGRRGVAHPGRRGGDEAGGTCRAGRFGRAGRVGSSCAFADRSSPDRRWIGDIPCHLFRSGDRLRPARANEHLRGRAMRTSVEIAP